MVHSFIYSFPSNCAKKRHAGLVARSLFGIVHPLFNIYFIDQKKGLLEPVHNCCFFLVFSTLGGACSLPIPGEDYMYNGHKQNIQSNVNTHQTTGFSSLFFFLILFYRLGNYLPSIPPSSISISLSRSPALDCSPCIDFISNYFIEYWREGTSHT